MGRDRALGCVQGILSQTQMVCWWVFVTLGVQGSPSPMASRVVKDKPEVSGFVLQETVSHAHMEMLQICVSQKAGVGKPLEVMQHEKQFVEEDVDE